MPAPRTAIQRVEFGTNYEEFDTAMSRQGFIGHEIFRPLFRRNQTGDVPQRGIQDVMPNSSRTNRRAVGAGYRRVSGRWTKHTFATEEYGVEELIDDRETMMYEDMFDQEMWAAERSTDQVLREYEINAATLANNTSVYTTTQAATAAFSVKATATPVADILTLVKTIEDACGLSPNFVAMDRALYREAKETNEVIDRLKYWGGDDPKNTTPAALAELFDVERVIIAGKLQSREPGVVIKNTANEGAASATLARIWSQTQVVVGVMANRPDPATTCLGRTVMWSKENRALGGGRPVTINEQYRDEKVRGDVSRSRMDYQLLQLTTACAGILTGC